MCFFSSIDYFFLPARTDLMNKIIAAAFWRQWGVPCASARRLAISTWLGLVALNLARSGAPQASPSLVLVRPWGRNPEQEPRAKAGTRVEGSPWISRVIHSCG